MPGHTEIKGWYERANWTKDHKLKNLARKCKFTRKMKGLYDQANWTWNFLVGMRL